MSTVNREHKSMVRRNANQVKTDNISCKRKKETHKEIFGLTFRSGGPRLGFSFGFKLEYALNVRELHLTLSTYISGFTLINYYDSHLRYLRIRKIEQNFRASDES
eukprot:scaffold174051_cov67-Cyclotella_meneghiniana.AAC.2